MKKALSYLIVFCLVYNVFMINISVFSYEYVDKDNEYFVELLKNEIYDITEEYYNLYGDKNDSISVGVFSGTLCPNGITVKGYGTISLEDYVAGVITAENNWSYGENIENMKAQAIAARTYGIINSNHCQTSIESSQAKQVYTKPLANSSAVRAAQETSGMILQYNGQLFNPEYDAFCVIEKTNDSYTINQPSQYHPGQHQVIPASFINQTQSSHKGIDYCFGHGKGMSQIGSRYLSTQGYAYDQILQYYYPTGIEIVKPSSSVNWKQCDSAWGHIKLGGSEGASLCDIGCYVTSMAILIAQSGAPTTLGDNFNPGTFAQYLISHNAFSNGGSLDSLSSVNSLVSGFSVGNPDYNTSVDNIRSYLSSGKYVQVHIKRPNGTQHFVAVTGVDGDKVHISDPGNSCTVLSDCYPPSYLSDLRIYTIG